VQLPVGPLTKARSCGLAAKAAPLQGDERWFESTQDYLAPRYANGRAAWLKPKRLQVRLLFWALNGQRGLGRQLADHPGSGTDAQRWSQGCCGFDSHLSH
jgi:hypothetical protein